MRLTQRTVAVAAVMFGIVTIAAGVRVLAGSDPGYTVFRPLLIFNTVMGVAYLAAGLIAWRSIDLGTFAAAVVFVLNFVVLGIIGYLNATGGDVAVDSVRAMIFRTAVWLGIFAGLAWIRRAARSSRI